MYNRHMYDERKEYVMKKVLTLLLAFVLVFSLVGCGESSVGVADDTNGSTDDKFAFLDKSNADSTDESTAEAETEPAPVTDAATTPVTEADIEPVTEEDTQTETAGRDDTQVHITTDSPETDGDGGGTVYITDSGSKYHREGCRHLTKSKIAIALSDAVARGYTPCKVCKP